MDVAVALRIVVVGVVRGERIVRVSAPALFGVVGLAQDEIGEKSESPLHRYRVRKNLVIGIADNVFFAFYTIAIEVFDFY